MPITKGLEWTFDTRAEVYEKMRPDYPPELYTDLFRYHAVGPSDRVLEIGIGGGQATLPFLQKGCRLTAVEYGANFAALCRRKFHTYPNFSATVSKFEDFASDSEQYDFIYSASAFHWVPEEIGYSKVFALLKSGGVFARFANHPHVDKGREALHQEIQRLYAIYMPGSKEPAEYGEADAAAKAEIARKYGFTDIAFRLYHRTRSFTAQEYTALLGTYSDHIALEAEVRQRFFQEIEAAIDRFGGQLTVYDTIDLQLARKP